MPESKANLSLVEKAYIDRITTRFPEVETEWVPESEGIADIWIRIKLPKERWELFDDVLETTVDLNQEFWEQTGVDVIATVVEKDAEVSGVRGSSSDG